jgi:hypothetical protein
MNAERAVLATRIEPSAEKRRPLAHSDQAVTPAFGDLVAVRGDSVRHDDLELVLAVAEHHVG